MEGGFQARSLSKRGGVNLRGKGSEALEASASLPASPPSGGGMRWHNRPLLHPRTSLSPTSFFFSLCLRDFLVNAFPPAAAAPPSSGVISVLLLLLLLERIMCLPRPPGQRWGRRGGGPLRERLSPAPEREQPRSKRDGRRRRRKRRRKVHRASLHSFSFSLSFTSPASGCKDAA